MLGSWMYVACSRGKIGPSTPMVFKKVWEVMVYLMTPIILGGSFLWDSNYHYQTNPGVSVIAVFIAIIFALVFLGAMLKGVEVRE